MVGARTALAWMGMANTSWRHIIEGHAINIRGAVTLLRQDVKKINSDKIPLKLLERRISSIEEQAIKILEKPITPPLASEETFEPVLMNQLIQERLAQLWEDDSYRNIALQIELLENTKVRISTDWFRRALDMLVENAAYAMKNSKTRNLNVSSRIEKGRLEILITDTGRGIPLKVQRKLFKGKIEKQKGIKGFGMGLLIVEAIMQAYEGNIRLHNSTSNGTTFILDLPLLIEN
jgi:C4-dicarboxylate-specific signal transduction histidine kinase